MGHGEAEGWSSVTAGGFPGVPGQAAGAGTGLSSRRLFCKREIDGFGQANRFPPSSPAGEEECGWMLQQHGCGMLRQHSHRMLGQRGCGMLRQHSHGCSISTAMGCSAVWLWDAPVGPWGC